MPMVFLANKDKIQNYYLNNLVGEQKFIKNTLKFDNKMNLVIIEKQSNAVIEYMF